MANEAELDVIRDRIKQPDASKEQLHNVIDQAKQPDGEAEHLSLEQIEQLDGEIHFAAVVTGDIDLPPEIQEINNLL